MKEYNNSAKKKKPDRTFQRFLKVSLWNHMTSFNHAFWLVSTRKKLSCCYVVFLFLEYSMVINISHSLNADFVTWATRIYRTKTPSLFNFLYLPVTKHTLLWFWRLIWCSFFYLLPLSFIFVYTSVIFPFQGKRRLPLWSHIYPHRVGKSRTNTLFILFFFLRCAKHLFQGIAIIRVRDTNSEQRKPKFSARDAVHSETARFIDHGRVVTGLGLNCDRYSRYLKVCKIILCIARKKESGWFQVNIHRGYLHLLFKPPFVFKNRR